MTERIYTRLCDALAAPVDIAWLAALRVLFGAAPAWLCGCGSGSAPLFSTAMVTSIGYGMT